MTFTQGQGQIVEVKGKKSNFAIFSKTIKATDIQFGIMVPSGKALQKMGLFGDLQPRSRSQCRVKGKKITLPCGSETIKVTVTPFGTIVLCGKVLQKIHHMVIFIQGQGHTRAIITKLDTRESYGLCPSCLFCFVHSIGHSDMAICSQLDIKQQ